MPDNPLFQGLQREQKIGLILLAFFTFFAIGLGFMQVRNTLYSKFSLTNSVPSSVKEEINSPEALSYRDTDFDGLNDYDETYVYHTSRYLADTDSDGVDDKTEIMRGTDPNCDPKKACTGESANVSNVSVTGTITNAFDPASIGTFSPGGVTGGAGILPLNGAPPDAAQLRQLLLKSGMDKKMLDQISDADLLKVAGQTSQEITSSSSVKIPAPTPAPTASGATVTAADLQSPARIRELLIQGGMDQAKANQISDADLLQAAKQILAAQQSTGQ